jgi:TatD DNase family protein
MIDTHCHLNIEPLYPDYQPFLQSALNAGVTSFIIPSTDVNSSKITLKIAAQETVCHPAIGLHPELITTDISKSPQVIAGWQSDTIELLETKKPVAVGEFGLDYFRLPEDNQDQDQIKQGQTRLCRMQLEMAKNFNLPVILHVRDAQADMLKLLEQYRPVGVLHCFSGDQEYLEKALELGLYISFAGNLTFNKAQNLQNCAKAVPLDRILVETDAPFLNPNRGQFPNTPANVVITAQYLANLLNLPYNRLEAQIHTNASQLFRIK